MKNILYYLCFILLIASCTSKKEEQSSVESEVQEEKLLCFRNEYPFEDNSGKVDVEELTLAITGNQVTGMYNWLPAEKDQRKGTFTGTITGKTINAKYTFMQEGIEESTNISIEIKDDKVSVNGGNPELGLQAEIKKADCN